MTRRSERASFLSLCLLLVGLRAAAQQPARVEDPHAPGMHVDCLRCHEPLKEKVARAVPHEPAAKGECASCHAPHAARYPKLLNQRERALCATCHAERIGEFMKGSLHTPVKNGQCTACHEVHGSANAGLLVREGNALCLECHAAKRAQAALPTLHDPFVNGECLDCHKAHNSPYPDQLAAPATNLCQLCHSGEDPKLTEAHSGIPVQGANCLACHEPHASASKGLLRTVVHQPFGEGSCDMCHMLESESPRLVRAVGARLCNACHKDYPRAADPVVHAPVQKGECNACHLPHTSDFKGLLASAPQTLCTSCHAPLVERAAKARSAHPIPADKGACLACHAPHSSTEPHLLASGEIRTCLACHETAKHGHPLGDDRLDPRTQKPITCVTCHDPHGTAFNYQLRGDQSRGLCVECHSAEHVTPTEKGKRGGRQ